MDASPLRFGTPALAEKVNARIASGELTPEWCEKNGIKGRHTELLIKVTSERGEGHEGLRLTIPERVLLGIEGPLGERSFSPLFIQMFGGRDGYRPVKVRFQRLVRDMEDMRGDTLRRLGWEVLRFMRPDPDSRIKVIKEIGAMAEKVSGEIERLEKFLEKGEVKNPGARMRGIEHPYTRKGFLRQLEQHKAMLQHLSAMASEELMEHLTDGNWFIRQAAVEALGNLRSEEAVDRLFQIATGDEWSPESKRSVYNALFKIGEKAVYAFVNVLSNNKSGWDLKVLAATKLGEMGTKAKGAEVCLRTVLNQSRRWKNGTTDQSKNEQHQRVHNAVAWALGRIGARGTIPDLIESAVYEDDPYSSSIEALVTLCKRYPDEIQKLVDALERGDLKNHVPIVWVLGRLGILAEPALPALVVKFHSQDVRLRQAARDAFVGIGGPAIDYLIGEDGLGYSDQAVRADSARALGNINPKREDAATALGARLTVADETAEVQLSSCEALVKYGESAAPAVGGLVFALASVDLQPCAVQALVNAGGFSVERLIEAYKEGDRKKQEAVKRALVTLGKRAGSDTVPLLIKELGDPKYRDGFREIIVAVGVDAVPSLVVSLDLEEERNPIVRMQAAETIGEITPPAEAALPALLQVSGNVKENPEVRDAATKAISKIVEALGPAGRRRLREVVGDPGTSVTIQARAVEALGRVLGEVITSDSNLVAVSLLEMVPQATPSMRNSIEVALQRMVTRDDTLFELLINSLGSSKLRVSQVAKYVLGQMGLTALPHLIRGLSNSKEAVKKPCRVLLIGLSERGLEGLIDVWRNCPLGLSDVEYKALQREVSDVVSVIGTPAVPRLREALGDGSPSVRRWAVRSLVAIKPIPLEAYADILKLLQDTNRSVAQTVSDAIRRFKPEDLFREYVKAKKKAESGAPDSQNNLLAIEAILIDVAASDFVQTVTLLDSGDQDICTAVEEILGKAPPLKGSDRSSLMGLFFDSNPRIRKTLYRAIGRMSYDDALPLMSDLQEKMGGDPDTGARDVAREAFKTLQEKGGGE